MISVWVTIPINIYETVRDRLCLHSSQSGCWQPAVHKLKMSNKFSSDPGEAPVGGMYFITGAAVAHCFFFPLPVRCLQR